MLPPTHSHGRYQFAALHHHLHRKIHIGKRHCPSTLRQPHESFVRLFRADTVLDVMKDNNVGECLTVKHHAATISMLDEIIP